MTMNEVMGREGKGKGREKREGRKGGEGIYLIWGKKKCEKDMERKGGNGKGSKGKGKEKGKE